MTSRFDHSENQQKLCGPQAFLPFLFELLKPKNLINVGCVVGTQSTATMNAWSGGRTEKWYRQNAFVAARKPEQAGREDRKRPVVHPAYIYRDNYEKIQDARFSSVMDIEDGMMTVGWYLSRPLKGLLGKFSNKISKSNRGKK